MPKNALGLFAMLVLSLYPFNLSHSKTTNPDNSRIVIERKENDGSFVLRSDLHNDNFAYDIKKYRYKSEPTIGIPSTHAAAIKMRIMFQNGNVGSCSGTSVGERLILTAAHCIASDDFILYVNDTKVEVESVIKDERDHAFIILKDGEFKFLKFARLGFYPKIGDNIYYWGNVDRATGILRKGYVAGYSGGNYYSDINTWMGDSGAGIFDEYGRVVGVVSGILGSSAPDMPALSYKLMYFGVYNFKDDEVKNKNIHGLLKYKCDSCFLTLSN